MILEEKTIVLQTVASYINDAESHVIYNDKN